MSFFRRIILIIGIVSISGILEARVVKIWPGINHIGMYNILTHISDYSNELNYVIIPNNGKKKLFPLPTELTYRLVKENLIIIANNLNLQSAEFYADNRKLINEYYKKTNKTLDNIKNDTDPFYLLATAFTELINMNTGTEQSDKNVDKIAKLIEAHIDVFVEAILSGGDPKKIIKDALYKPLCNIVVTFYNVNPNKHPIINFLISKFADITGDILYETIEHIKDGEKFTELSVVVSKKITLEGVWDALGVWQNYIEAMIDSAKIYNILSTMDQLSNNTNGMILHNYVGYFIKDYVEKYNMNINLMVNDSSYCFDWAFDGSCASYSKPHNFFQLFVLYGLNHGYLKGINLDSYAIEDLWLLAHKVLYLIENFGDGGNNKIILNINADGNIKINPASYALNQLYWMLPLTIKNKVFLDYTSNNMVFGNIQHNIFIADNDLKNYNPYSNNSLFETKKHINITFKYYKTVNLNLQGKYLYIDNLEKIINYNGLLEKNGISTSYQIYNKIKILFNKLYVPLYKVKLPTKEQQKIINRLIPSGIIPTKPNLILYLFSFTTKKDIKDAFRKYEYLTNSKFYSENKLNELLKNLKNNYITKKQFLYFIYRLFYDKNGNYTLPFNKDIPYYVGCLYNKNIVKEINNLDAPITNIEMYIILYRLFQIGVPK